MSPIVANLFPEEFETKAINTTSTHSGYGLGMSYAIQKSEHNQQFLQHIKSIDPPIQLIAESPNIVGSIPFMDIVVSPGPGNSLLTTVTRSLPHRPVPSLQQPSQFFC